MTTLNQSIINIRVKLQNAKLKKSGKNKVAGFDYFELADFLPKLNELMQEEGVNDLFTIEDEKATLTLIKEEEGKGVQTQVYSIPFILFETPVNLKQVTKSGEIREIKTMQDIQYLGALNTYYKRYLYLNAFGITDGDVIDALDNGSTQTKKVMATEKQIAKVKELVSDIPSMLKYYNVEKIEGLTIEQASEIIAKKGSKK